VKNRSVSNAPNNRTTSWNESTSKVPVISPDEILGFLAGQCVMTNPAYASGDRGSIPYKLKVSIPRSDLKRQKQSQALWDSTVRPRLQQRVGHQSLEALSAQLALRVQAAQELLPDPAAVKSGF
jgi:hypothetical protein